MPRTRAKGGFGTRLDYQDDAGNWITVQEVRNITFPNHVLHTDEATHMDSPGGAEEFIATGGRSSDDCTFDLNVIENEATHTQLQNDSANGTLRNFRSIYPPSVGRRLSFSAFCMSVKESKDPKQTMIRQITLKISGQIVRENHP